MPKVYKNRECRIKQEDLVRRFLDGMKDNEARFKIEYHKEPGDIDQAAYHAVNLFIPGEEIHKNPIRGGSRNMQGEPM